LADHDLMIAGPSTVTLTPANGRYEGTLKVVVANVGQQVSEADQVQVRLPTISDLSGSVEIGCGRIGPPGQPSDGRQWVCAGKSAFYVIPARGGHATYTIPIAVNIAPQQEQMSISGISVWVVAKGLSSDTNQFAFEEIEDATPANNQLSVTLILTNS